MGIENLKKLALVLLLITMAGCGMGVGTSTGNPSTTKNQAFPTNLAVASPLETVANGGSVLTTVTLFQETSFQFAYQEAVEKISATLNGTTNANCLFDPALFLTNEENASCYGPLVPYENHPDYTGAPPPAPQEDGTLPTGDVGIWMVSDATTGHACAAAQLNSRMEAMRDRSVVALMGLASLICAATVNGEELPFNSTLDLTAEMNGLGITNTTFSAAMISHSNASGNHEWSYEMDLTFSPGPTSFDIVVELTHRPGSNADIYAGLLSYRINEQFNPPANCPSLDQTYNGSFAYHRSAADNLQTQTRGARFCNHDSNGLTNGLVDPANKFNRGANPNGWVNNFSIFTANFDPTSLVGDYSFTWQAGDLDGYTRVFDAHLEENQDSTTLEADTFYGFGQDVTETNGGITEFFCNWAGPNGKAFGGGISKNLAQFQSMRLDTTTGKFNAVTSNVTYTPINSCDYDGMGSFSYDSNADGVIDTDPATAISNDLVTLVDSDGDGVFDAIEESGFTLPFPPPNL